MWTFQDRGLGMRCQLDYILVRRKWRNSILNAEPCSSFNSVGSDHRVVSMKVRLSLRVPKPSCRIRCNWKEFSSRPDIQERYTVVVRNHYQLLQEDEDPTKWYGRFIKANEIATKECVPKQELVKKSLQSKHPDITAAREAVKLACLSCNSDQTEENKQAHRMAKQHLFYTYDKLKEKALNERTQRIEAERSTLRRGHQRNNWTQESKGRAGSWSYPTGKS